MFYNTTNEDQNTLKNMSVSNAKQEDIVLAIYSQHKSLAPSQALSLYLVITGKQRTPITSIRRAISDLTRQGRLAQTDRQHTSPYGKSEWIWEFKTMESEIVKTDRIDKGKVIQHEGADPVKKAAAINRLKTLYNFIDQKTWIEVKSELMNLLDDLNKL